MKKLIVFIFLTIGTASAQTFTIKGHIKGIEIGDTLRFEKVILPSWTLEKAFDLIVETDNEFIYSGEHSHTHYYMMQYFPIKGTSPKVTKRGIPILIQDGEITINGTRDLIYFSTVSGGFYDSELKAIKALEDSLSIARSAWIPLIDKAFKEDKDTITGRALNDEFNKFAANNLAHFNHVKRMESDYALKTGNEYVAAKACEMLWKPLDELEDSYSKLTDKAQKSYFGALLYSNIAKLKSLAAGQSAPYFTFKTINAEAISLSDLRGKYVIVYHFGLCPGSIQMDPLVAELYNNHRDKVEVIGLTESMANLKKTCADIPEDAIMNGVNFKKAITNMTNHPWKYEAETKTDKNAGFIDNYNVNGLPYFVVISPDGKIVSRGFHEAFLEAQKLIK